MTAAIIAAIIQEIDAYGSSKRSGSLTWKALETFSGFSKPAMWAKPEIRNTFRRVYNAQRAVATPIIKQRRTVDQRVATLEKILAALRE